MFDVQCSAFDVEKLFLQQRVFHAVHERLEAGFDDILAHADGAPLALAVAGYNEHARFRRRAGGGIEDAHLVIGERYVFQLRK